MTGSGTMWGALSMCQREPLLGPELGWLEGGTHQRGHQVRRGQVGMAEQPAQALRHAVQGR